MNSAQFYEQNMLSRPALLNCCFEEASTANLPKYLYQVEPGTPAACMRDSLMTSTSSLNKLHNILKMAGTTGKWRFFTLVFCSMQDKISNTTEKDFLNYIDKTHAEWIVEQKKIIFIPIQMCETGLNKIQQYCEKRGERVEYYSTDIRNLSQVLKHIYSSTINSSKKGLAENEQINDQSNHAKEIEVQEEKFNLALSILIEASQKMAGQKWVYLINVLCSFLENLSPHVLINGIVYNSIKLLSMQPPKLQTNQKPAPYKAPKQYKQIEYLPILQYPKANIKNASMQMQQRPHYRYPLLPRARPNYIKPSVQSRPMENQVCSERMAKILGILIGNLIIATIVYFVSSS